MKKKAKDPEAKAEESNLKASNDIVLDDWQEEVLAYKGHFLLCTGRRVGKTYIMARKACQRMIENPGYKIVIASLTEDQAKLIIIMILSYFETHYKKMIAKGKDRPTQNRVTLINKSSALARPVGTTGDALRGFEGDVLILDEVSRFNELIMTAATPILLTTGGEIWMCSTPFGKKGYFWECFQNKNNRFKVFYKSSEEVINNRPISNSWTEKQRAEAIRYLEEEKKDKSQLVYGQEYMGLFLEELRQYFPDELIIKCCSLRRPGAPVPKDNNYLGVDIARMGGDECAYEILNKTNSGKIHHIENITKKNQLTTKTEEDILYLNEFWQPLKIGIDAGSGSLGVGIFDRLMQNIKTARKVVAMNNRSMSLDRQGKAKQRIFKEDMYENMLNMMEKGELALLEDDNVIASLKSIQWELDKKGAITKIRIFSDYGHIVEGLTRAAFLCKKEKINKLWISYA